MYEISENDRRFQRIKHLCFFIAKSVIRTTSAIFSVILPGVTIFPVSYRLSRVFSKLKCDSRDFIGLRRRVRDFCSKPGSSLSPLNIAFYLENQFIIHEIIKEMLAIWLPPLLVTSRKYCLICNVSTAAVQGGGGGASCFIS